MKRYFPYSIFLLLLLILSFNSPLDTFIRDLMIKLNSFHKTRSQETIYIQTDKSLYTPKEEIWFTLFVNEQTEMSPTRLSNIVYLELYGPNGNRIQEKVCHLNDGIASGKISLSDEERGGIYRLRAYTKWMQNFGEECFATKEIQLQKVITPRLLLTHEFEKEAYGSNDLVTVRLNIADLKNEACSGAKVQAGIYIDGALYQEHEVESKDGKALVDFRLPSSLTSTDGLFYALVSYNGVEESISRSIPIVLNKIELKFYPEGGNLVEGLPANLAFEAMNEFNKGADIKGELLDDENNVLTTFESYHKGMGAFSFSPKAGTNYKVRIVRPEGISEYYPLPKVEKEGFVLQKKEQTDKKIVWSIYSENADNGYWAMHVHGKWSGGDPISIQKGVTHLEISTENLPMGIAVFTLFNNKGEPQCERLVFVNKNKQLNIRIKTDKKEYRPKEEVQLDIFTSDLEGKPVSAQLSLAVVDEQLLNFADDKQDNILSRMFLTSELKGEIQDPSFYFDLKQEKAEQATDYLLLTHGWRRFNWSDIQNPSDKILVAPENTYAIHGYLVDFNNKPIQGEVTIVDDKYRALTIKTDNRGFFSFYGTEYATLYTLIPNQIVILEGEKISPPQQQVLADLREVESKEETVVIEEEAREVAVTGMKSEFVDTERKMKKQETEPKSIVEPTPSASSTKKESKPKRVKIKGGSSRSSRSDTSNSGGSEGGLDEVVIVAYSRRNMGLPLNKIMGVFPSTADASDNRIAYGQSLNSLGHGDGDPTYTIEDQNFNLKKFTKDCVFSSTSLGFMSTVPISRIPSVANNGYISFVSSNSKYLPKRTIYKHSKYLSVRVDRRKLVEYSREFYQTKSSSEKRTNFKTTVYWKSNIETDKEGNAKISFYNNDAVSAFRITTEGVTKGLVGRNEYTYSSNLPVNIDVKFPPYLGYMDTLVLPVSVRNNLDTIISSTVDLAISKELQIVGDFRKKIVLNKGESRTLYFNVVSRKTEGCYPIEVRLNTDGFKDKVRTCMSVCKIGFPQSLSVSGTKSIDTTFKIPPYEDGSLTGKLLLYNNSFQEMTNGVEAIIREPHGCFEQLAASNYPNIFALQLLKYQNSYENRLYSIENRAKQALNEAYIKMAAYESRGGGFEWFGGAKGNEMLSAYGLLQFKEMKKVYSGIDPKLEKRVLEFILSRQKSSGGFHQYKGKYGFGEASQIVNDTYICFALSELISSHIKFTSSDLEITYQYCLKRAEEDGDMYRLALMANAAFNLAKHNDYDRLIKLFIQELNKGHNLDLLNVKESIVLSSTKTSETVAFWVQALVKVLIEESNKDEFMDLILEHKAVELRIPLEKCINYLLAKRSNYGFGSTQATALSLQAFTLYTKYFAIHSPDALLYTINQKERNLYKAQNPILQAATDSLPKDVWVGENTLTTTVNYGSLPYMFLFEWSSLKPDNSEQCPLVLKTNLQKTEVRQNEMLRLNIELVNKESKGQAMSIAVIGIPAGTSILPWQLKELQEKEVFDFYEFIGTRLALYYRELGPKEVKKISLDLKADIPGSYLAPASSCYLYYQSEHRYWKQGLSVKITNF